MQNMWIFGLFRCFRIPSFRSI